MNKKPAKILIVQLNSSITRPFGHLFPSEHFEVQVLENGDHVLDTIVSNDQPDLVIVDHAVQRQAIELCRTLKADLNLRMIPILLVATEIDPLLQTEAFEAGSDDFLTRPIIPQVFIARVRSLLRTKLLMDELDSAENVLYTLARTIEAKDRYTMGHADRVANYAVELGKLLKVSSDEVETLRKGGMLHDIGKIAIPDAILTKPGKYEAEEFEVMKRHPVLGCEICEKLKTVKDSLPLIRHHHERLDGSGYPDGLKGAAIPATVRVVSIVDIYDALRSKRSYKDAFTIDKTFEIMWQEADKGWWDKDILKVWERNIRSKSTDPFPA